MDAPRSRSFDKVELNGATHLLLDALHHGNMLWNVLNLNSADSLTDFQLNHLVSLIIVGGEVVVPVSGEILGDIQLSDGFANF